MRHICQLCRNFCSSLQALKIDDGPLIGAYGPCCNERVAERIALLRERHPGRVHDALSMAEFRELTHPVRLPYPYSLRRFRDKPKD